MTKNDADYTGKMCDLNPQTGDWPMYSFNNAAHSFWNGFANALRERGLTDEQIKDELQSKGVRWVLDSEGCKLEELGRQLGKKYSLHIH